MNRETRGKTVLEPKNDVGESANNQQTYLTFVPEKQSKKRGRAALRNEEDENITWRLRLRIHPWSLKRFNYSRVYIFENELELRCYHSSFVARSEQLLVNRDSVKVCWRHSELPKALETATSKQFLKRWVTGGEDFSVSLTNFALTQHPFIIYGGLSAGILETWIIKRFLSHPWFHRCSVLKNDPNFYSANRRELQIRAFLRRLVTL